MIIWCHQSGSLMVTAVDSVLVLRASPACYNTECRHSTQQTLFLPLSMNPSALGISISTINPYPIQLSALLNLVFLYLSVLYLIHVVVLYLVCVIVLGSTFAGPAFCATLISWQKLIILTHSKCSQQNMLYLNGKICSWICFTCVVPIYQT